MLLAVFGQTGDAGFNGVPGLTHHDSLSGLLDALGIQRIGAKDGAHDFRPTCSDEAGDAEHLAGSNLEINIFEGASAGQSMGREYPVVFLHGVLMNGTLWDDIRMQPNEADWTKDDLDFLQAPQASRTTWSGNMPICAALTSQSSPFSNP